MAIWFIVWLTIGDSWSADYLATKSIEGWRVNVRIARGSDSVGLLRQSNSDRGGVCEHAHDPGAAVNGVAEPL